MREEPQGAGSVWLQRSAEEGHPDGPERTPEAVGRCDAGTPSTIELNIELDCSRVMMMFRVTFSKYRRNWH